MTDREPPLGEDEDLGAPIDELRSLRVDAPSGFVGRLRRVLQRRALGSQVATLSWTGFGAVALEFLKVIFSIFEPPAPDEGGAD